MLRFAFVSIFLLSSFGLFALSTNEINDQLEAAEKENKLGNYQKSIEISEKDIIPDPKEFD